MHTMSNLVFVLLTSSIILSITETSYLVGGNNTAVIVTRRVKDSYNLLQGGELACNTALNVTYLVHDDECITNQDLFNGK